MNTTSTIDPLILSFAEAVRAQLDDLPAEEVDDLTEGLEADLTEQAADAGAPSLGDPVEYAAELRSAAGLPAREFPVVSLWAFEPVIEWWARVRAATGRVIHSNPVIASVARFLGSIRPVWWIARGWGLFMGVQAILLSRSIEYFVPRDLIDAFVLIPLLIVSVQWGRGNWMPRPWLRVLRVLASIAALASLFLFVVVSVEAARYQSYDDVYVEPVGLTQEGESITNIFAYGPDGEPIADVRLFDQNGTPISVVGSYDPELYPELLSVFDGSYRLVPNYASPDGSIWDIYPLRQGHVDENGEIDPTQPTTDARSPFDRLLPLQGAEPAPTTTPAPLR
jgi:hypothetical protein